MGKGENNCQANLCAKPRKLRVGHLGKTRRPRPEVYIPDDSKVIDKPYRDKLVLDHMEHVRFMARELGRKVPSSVAEDDLMQAGLLGLIDAAARFETCGLKFWTFAAHRVRGAMLDLLRGMDGAARSTRVIQKRSDTFYWEFQRKFGRTPTDEEVAGHLKMPVERWRRWKVRLLYTSEVSIERKYANGDCTAVEFKCTAPKPDEQAAMAEIQEHLRSALMTLPPRYRQVLEEYFYHDQTLSKTGKMLEVVESRASQIKTAALARLRTELENRGITFAKV